MVQTPVNSFFPSQTERRTKEKNWKKEKSKTFFCNFRVVVLCIFLFFCSFPRCNSSSSKIHQQFLAFEANFTEISVLGKGIWGWWLWSCSETKWASLNLFKQKHQTANTSFLLCRWVACLVSPAFFPFCFFLFFNRQLFRVRINDFCFWYFLNWDAYVLLVPFIFCGSYTFFLNLLNWYLSAEIKFCSV